jgi:hypothetical protein
MLALGMILITTEARAGFTGNQLHEICKTDNYSCDWYVAGVVETWNMLGYLWTDHEGPWLCWPNEANYNQLADIVTIYLREHPEIRHNSAALLVWQAIANKFPQGGC